MHVLITGNAGCLGSHIADRLLADGHTITGVDNLLTGRRENIDPRVAFIGENIQHLQNLLAISGAPDLIVHCAASYDDPLKWHRDAETNVLGTINATIWAQESNCSIVYLQTALPPISSYAISKTAGMQYIRQSGVPHTILRLANIYGPRNLSGPIPTFYKRLTEGLPCTVVATTRDMLYVHDLVDAVMVAITTGQHGTFDISSGEQTLIQELYELVDESLDTITPYTSVEPGPDDTNTVLDVANRLPGWEPRTALRTGIEAAVAWYKQNPPDKTYTHLNLPEDDDD